MLHAETSPLRPGCVRFDYQTEDTDDATRSLLRGVRCLHPQFPRYAVSLLYSERVPAGLSSPAPAGAVEAFLESLQFAPERPLYVSSAALGQQAGALLAAAGRLWFIDERGVTALDLQNHQRRSIGFTFKALGGPRALAEGTLGIWVAQGESGAVARIDLQTERVAAEVRTGGTLADVAACGGSVWVTDAAHGEVVRIDERQEAVLARVPIGNDASAVACDASAVWVASRADDTLTRLDPAGGAAQRVKTGGQPGALALAHGSIWVANQLDRTVARLDARTLLQTALIALPSRPAALLAAGAGVWVALKGEVLLIDAQTNLPGQPVPVPAPMAMALAAGALWVTSVDGQLSRIEQRSPRRSRGRMVHARLPRPAASSAQALRPRSRPRRACAAGSPLSESASHSGAVAGSLHAISAWRTPRSQMRSMA